MVFYFLQGLLLGLLHIHFLIYRVWTQKTEKVNVYFSEIYCDGRICLNFAQDSAQWHSCVLAGCAFDCTTFNTPNFVVERLTRLFHIREVPDSNFGPETTIYLY
jgi:hypothetical protein